MDWKTLLAYITGSVDQHLLLRRACRGTAVGSLGQRFQPKEHWVLILG